MGTVWRAPLLFAAVLLFCAAAHAQNYDEEIQQALEGQVILTMASERVVGSSIIDALVRTFLAQQGLRDIAIKRSPDLAKLTYTGIAIKGEKKSVVVTILPREKSLDALRRNSVDAALVAQQRVSASRKMGSTDVLVAGTEKNIQIGETAAFVIVSPKNSVNQLTFRELRLILLGAITDWSQLGGLPGKIKPVGTSQLQPAIDLVADLVHLDPENLDDEATALLQSRRGQVESVLKLDTFDEVFDKIANDRNAITIQFPHIPPSVKALKLGVDKRKFTAPDADTIKSKDYPLAYSINLHYLGGQKNAAVAGLVRAGESLEMEVSLALAGAALPGTEMLSLIPDPSAPRAYLDATKYGMMVSKSIHFKADSLDLTENGKAAVGRVANKLLSIRQDAGKIRVIGFSDSQSSAEESQAVGLNLARLVAAELKKRNVNTGYIYSLGDTMPLDEGTTTHGRERNRRVQIWIVP